MDAEVFDPECGRGYVSWARLAGAGATDSAKGARWTGADEEFDRWQGLGSFFRMQDRLIDRRTKTVPL